MTDPMYDERDRLLEENALLKAALRDAPVCERARRYGASWEETEHADAMRLLGRAPASVYQRSPDFDVIKWHSDPAASGPRFRAFVEIFFTSTNENIMRKVGHKLRVTVSDHVDTPIAAKGVASKAD